MEPLTASAIATLAFTVAAEKLTEAGLGKLNQLREKIGKRLRGRSEAEKVLTEAENVPPEAVEVVTGYLEEEMQKDPDFAKEVNDLAQEIINIGKIENWSVTGGQVIKDNTGTVYAPSFEQIDGDVNLNY
ncbi:MAG: hypothetical protein AB4290_02980 [Spirulina sp.]